MPGNPHDHIADEHFNRLPSFAASQSELSTFASASDYWESDPGVATSTKFQPSAQPRVAKSFTGGTNFDFDSRTGEQLTKSKSKRRQSKEEKASSQRVRRRGGSCDVCSYGHRKVKVPGASAIQMY